MNEILQTLILSLVYYVILGVLLVCLLSTLLRFLKPNAATRHSIWLFALMALVLIPIVVILSDQTVQKLDAYREDIADLNWQLGAADSAGSKTSPLFAWASTDNILSKKFSAPDNIQLSSTIRKLKAENFELARLVALDNNLVSKAITAAMFLIGVGMLLKIFLFARALKNLQNLYKNSENVSGALLQKVVKLADQIGLKKYPDLKCSEGVTAPLTSGIFRPWIVVPSTWISDSSTDQEFIHQALIHELAHIKRADALIATIQALVSIFTYWHPAFFYINRQIRFERELACDDWVIRFHGNDSKSKLKHYARCLLTLATSVQVGPDNYGHAVGCIRTSSRLGERIKKLLDWTSNHSTSIQSRSYGLCLVLILLTSTISIVVWPDEEVIVLDTAQRLAANPDVIELVVESSPEARLQSTEDASAVESEADVHHEEIVATPAVVESNVSDIEPNRTVFSPQPDRNKQSKESSVAPENHVVDPATAILAVLNESNEPGTITNKTEKNKVQSSENNQPGAQNKIGVADIVSTTPDSEETRAGEREVIIIEDLSKAELLEEIRRVEKQYYSVFNANTVDKKLQIICGTYRPTNSRITQSYCEPRFIVASRSQNAQYQFAHDEIGQESMPTLVNANIVEFRQLTEAMNSLMESNEYFRDLNFLLRILKGRLAEIS